MVFSNLQFQNCLGIIRKIEKAIKVSHQKFSDGHFECNSDLNFYFEKYLSCLHFQLYFVCNLLRAIKFLNFSVATITYLKKTENQEVLH